MRLQKISRDFHDTIKTTRAAYLRNVGRFYQKAAELGSLTHAVQTEGFLAFLCFVTAMPIILFNCIANDKDHKPKPD